VLTTRLVSIESDLPPGDVLSRLASRTAAISSLYAWTRASLDATLETNGSLDTYVGQIGVAGFRVIRASYVGGLGPVIDGTVSPVGTHSRITAHVAYDVPARLASIAFILAFTVVAIILAREFPAAPLFAGAALICGLVLITLHVRLVRDVQRFQGTLARILSSPHGGA
jgi:hypothetical protein